MLDHRSADVKSSYHLYGHAARNLVLCMNHNTCYSPACGHTAQLSNTHAHPIVASVPALPCTNYHKYQPVYRSKLNHHYLCDASLLCKSRLTLHCTFAERGRRDRGPESYSVRLCRNTECHRSLWNRDVNASATILRLFLDWAEGRPKPPEFCLDAH